jgi:outer membrane protein TolC
VQQFPLEHPVPGTAAADPGSTIRGTIIPKAIDLTLEQAIQRGLRYNLSTIEASATLRAARAQRLASAAQLLPDITGYLQETVQQIDLAALGLRGQPGLLFPTIVGPFNYFDLRGQFAESLSLTGLRNWRASRENLRAADLSLKDTRELVALAVSNAYLQLIASAARVATVKVQIVTAQAVYQQAVDRNKSGLSARIDVTRSLVELQTQQQRLTSLTNEFEKEKIALARLIGLPLGQTFTLADAVPFRELPMSDLDELIREAVSNRADVKAATAQVRAAEYARKAAAAEAYPWFDFNADYGAIGVNPSQSHGTFAVVGGVRFPIFRFGRIRADIDQADAVLAQYRAEQEDVVRRAEQDVRVATLDIITGVQQVHVAESNRKLAAETLDQARDRFRSGVANTVEVVQAQESVSQAEQDYINAVYVFSVAQVNLARATGDTQQGVARLLRGR